VVDMLYFPMFEGYFPEFLPWIGGNRFLFFSAIFNVADSAIFIGAVSLLVFSRRFFPESEETIDGEQQADAFPNQVRDRLLDGEQQTADDEWQATAVEKTFDQEQNTQNEELSEKK